MDASRPLVARFGEFQIDESNARLTRAGQALDLPPKSFALLCALARQPGQLVTKDALLDAVWGHRHVSESVLKTTISQLRNVLADDARQPRYIETASRRGYRFIAEVGAAARDVSAAAALPAAQEPSPAALQHERTELIGRDAALAWLHRRLADALGGRRQVVLIAGEAGIGKTSLMDRFVDGLDAPMHALGQCVEHYGVGEPYMPVLEALNMLCRAERDRGIIDLMRSVAPTWLVQMPWYLDDDDRRRLQREVAGATQDRMLREFGELLDRHTARHAVLLMLEDLHWSDHATVQLIGYLARRRTRCALMLLGSFRPTEAIITEHPLAALRHELRAHRLCEEIDLETFSEAEVGEFVARRLDVQSAPESFVQALHAHTEGLPLFVASLLDELLATGAVRRDGDAWTFASTTQFSVPRTVLGVVEKQIARLPPAQQEVLGAASVASAEFSPGVLAHALRMAPDDVQRALATGEDGGPWLHATGVDGLSEGRLETRYAFRHALYRHVFYHRLGMAQRMQLHRRMAEALQATQGARAIEAAAELAMHFERAGAPREAIGQLIIVARRALARSAADDALHAARHAQVLLERLAPESADAGIALDLCVLEGVALSRVRVVSDPEVGAIFQRAHALCDRAGDNPATARALHGLWWVSFARGALDRALAHAQRILALAERSADGGLRLAGASAMGMTLTMKGDLCTARQYLDDAVAAYATVREALPPGMFVQDPGVESMGYLAMVSWWMGEPARARSLAAEAIALARDIRHPMSELIAHHLDAVLHYFSGEMAQVLQSTQRIFDVIRLHGLPPDPGPFSWLHGHAVAALGDVDVGLAEMRAAERSCRALGMNVALTGYSLHMAEACRDAGRNAEGQAVVEAGIEIAMNGQERFLLSALHRVRAELRAQCGDATGAASDLRVAREIALAQAARFHELAALVSTRSILGPNAEADRRLHELLVDYGDERIALTERARALLAPTVVAPASQVH